MSFNAAMQFSPPPDGARDKPEIALQWILENVPCFDVTPIEWTNAIYREALRWKIKPSTLADAFGLARERGYSIAASVIRPIEKTSTEPRWTKPKNVQSPKEAAIAHAKVLESQYELASLANNSKEMKRIAKEFERLLNRSEGEGIPGEEIQHGARLLRRTVVRPREEPQPGFPTDPSGGGPYRVSPWLTNPPRPPRRGR
jgi:hypothetical protein